ncbi:leucyl/phenylalanyl-tRNA--protein transferase [bacterium K02(2017)]|nr:leucyl/phenylalanyl-tRNA--protein transferase [bacterium K02(2017)]
MYRLPDLPQPLDFPNHFETSPEGLLAVGGNLHYSTLINAYSKGIFPWYSEGEEILWWHPHPRAILLPENVHISRRIRRYFKSTKLIQNPSENLIFESFQYLITINRDFSQVMRCCAMTKRVQQNGTWITQDMQNAYKTLHDKGFAHSFEVWNQEKKLVGGIYGVAIGKIFFGESMFSLETNASKWALFHLSRFMVQNKMLLLDCQVESEHLKSLGAELIERQKFMDYLNRGQTYLKQQSSCLVNIT